MTTGSPTSREIVRLVAAREFTTRVRTKAFAISVAVTLAILVIGIIAISVISGKASATTFAVSEGSSEFQTALEASAKSFDESVEIADEASEKDARAQVADGSVDIAVISRPDDSFLVVTEKDLGTSKQGMIEAAAQQVGLDRALANQGVDAERFAQDVSASAVEVDVLDPSDPDKDQRAVLAYAAVLLLFFSVYLYGLYVAMGVVEEKSSKVVELLLSTIKPIHLLIGKVLGIGAVGLVQILLFAGAGLATGMATDLITVTGTAITLMGFVVLWYVLGFTFFAMLYAAFGSLVSRQEDVNSATMPLSILAFATFFSAQAALGDPSSSWINVLAWVPPFSATVMPLRVAADVATPLEMIGTVGVNVVVTVAAAVFAARVYENSVLNTGGRQSLRSALNR